MNNNEIIEILEKGLKTGKSIYIGKEKIDTFTACIILGELKRNILKTYPNNEIQKEIERLERNTK